MTLQNPAHGLAADTSESLLAPQMILQLAQGPCGESQPEVCRSGCRRFDDGLLQLRDIDSRPSGSRPRQKSFEAIVDEALDPLVRIGIVQSRDLAGFGDTVTGGQLPYKIAPSVERCRRALQAKKPLELQQLLRGQRSQ